MPITRTAFVRPTPCPTGWLALAPHIQRRLDANISQSALAVAMGLHPSALSRLERGRVPRITPQHVARYTDALESMLSSTPADADNSAVGG